MTNNFCALCAGLLRGLDENRHPEVRYPGHLRLVMASARAELAKADEPDVPEDREPASVTGRPSDEEIMGLMPQQMHEDLAYAARAMANEAGTDNRKAKGFMRIALNRHAVDLARAVLARWGNPAPAPPADGEVAELVAEIRHFLAGYQQMRGLDPEHIYSIHRGDKMEAHITVSRLTRAAELLERQVLVPPPADGEVAELVTELQSMATDADRRCRFSNAERLSRAAELLQRLSPPQPLANGEVGKPVAWMCPAEPYFDGNKWHDQWQVTLDQRLAEYWARPGKPTPLFTRAAELLQRQVLVPVSVSERPWEREGWCDAEGRCWLGSDALDGCTPTWLYGSPAWAERFPNVHRVLLPAHALPLPEVGE